MPSNCQLICRRRWEEKIKKGENWKSFTPLFSFVVSIAPINISSAAAQPAKGEFIPPESTLIDKEMKFYYSMPSGKR
jgi:hypothetical protein